MAKHIINLDIDDRFRVGDVTLVNYIAKVTMDNWKVKNFYSFATKYCNHHKHEDGFYKFINDDLEDYIKFKNILLKFSSLYSLDDYNLKDIYKCLLQLGKEKFPKKY